jgi:hypothetical protein
MPNLGIPTTVKRQRALNRFQFYPRLVDALYWASGPNAEHLRELADSFSSDLLNLAVLSGRLMRSAAMRPGGYFSNHDLIDIGVDVESFFVMLQTACDVMADVVCTLGVRKKGQAPHESFHRLQNWAARELKSSQPRIKNEYAQLITSDLPWFTELNAIRTKLVHRGNTVRIFTDGLGFAWKLDGADSENTPPTDLLTSLQALTRNMLEFSNDLSLLTAPDEQLQSHPQKRIIDGLYVPALDHLLNQYTRPVESEDLYLTADCLRACRGYIEAAFIGYPDGFWWTCVVEISRVFAPMRASRVFVRSHGAISDCRFVFTDHPRNFGIIACDVAKDDHEWRRGVADSARGLRDDYVTAGVAVVTRYAESQPPAFLEDIPLVVADDPAAIAKGCLAAWGIPRPELARRKP